MAPPTRFRPALNKLEDRTTPAGNITARVVDGTLFVTGDDADNAVVVAGTGRQSVAVRPGDATTTINGLPAGQGLFIGGITKGIVVRTEGGNDTVTLEGVRNGRYVGVFSGEGDDVVTLSGVNARGTAEVVTEDGTDTVRVVNSTFRRSLAANLGAGNDTLEITGSDVRDLTRLNGGDGQDSLGAAGGQFKRSIGYANFEGVFNGPIPPTPPVPPPPIAPTAPTVTAASSAGESTAAAQIPFSFTFSQPVSGLIDTAIDVSNGTVSNLTSPDRRTFTFNVTPTADGVVTVSLPANAVTDDQGRQNSASNTVTVRSIRTDAGMVPRDAPPNPNDPNFVAASNGLATWDVVPGSGTAITGNTTRVQAFYTGWLTDGTSFDAGRTTGQPVPFTLPNGVIPGFAQGLIGMQVGGIRRIRIPAELGYGNNPPPGSSIPPNATLIFEVKLVTIG